MNESFGKAYKLCSQKLIDQVFKGELKIKSYPFVLHYALAELPTKKSFQLVISAPKRIFRKAHDRNRIKRLMREVIRKKKLTLEQLLEEKNQQIALFLIYTSKEEPEYAVLEKKMEQLLTKLIQTINIQQDEIQSQM